MDLEGGEAFAIADLRLGVRTLPDDSGHFFGDGRGSGQFQPLSATFSSFDGSGAGGGGTFEVAKRPITHRFK